MSPPDKKNRRKSKTSSMDSESQLSAVLDTVGEGIIAIDSGSAVIMVNREFENIWGYKREEIIGEDLTKLMP